MHKIPLNKKKDTTMVFFDFLAIGAKVFVVKFFSFTTKTLNALNSTK